MSSEAWLGELVDGRTDVFSLACVIYEMLAGRRAFEGDDIARLMDAARNEDPPRLPTLRSDVPEELAEIVHWGLTRNVDHRPTMAEFRARLELFMRDWSARQAAGVPNLHSTMLSTSAPTDDLPLAGRPTQAAVDADRKDFRMRAVAPDPTRPNRTKPPERKSRRALAAVLIGTTLVLLGAGGWVLLRAPHAAEKTPPALLPPSTAVAMPDAPAPVAKPSKPWVKIETEPPGATVIRDGTELGETPLRIESADEKPMKVRLVLEGHVARDEAVMPMKGGGAAQFRMVAAKVAPEKREHHRKKVERIEKATSPIDRPKRTKDTVTDPFGGE
jgi:serine/threonine-protein kinase